MNTGRHRSSAPPPDYHLIEGIKSPPLPKLVHQRASPAAHPPPPPPPPNTRISPLPPNELAKTIIAGEVNMSMMRNFGLLNFGLIMDINKTDFTTKTLTCSIAAANHLQALVLDEEDGNYAEMYRYLVNTLPGNFKTSSLENQLRALRKDYQNAVGLILRHLSASMIFEVNGMKSSTSGEWDVLEPMHVDAMHRLAPKIVQESKKWHTIHQKRHSSGQQQNHHNNPPNANDTRDSQSAPPPRFKPPPSLVPQIVTAIQNKNILHHKRSRTQSGETINKKLKFAKGGSVKEEEDEWEEIGDDLILDPGDLGSGGGGEGSGTSTCGASADADKTKETDVGPDKMIAGSASKSEEADNTQEAVTDPNMINAAEIKPKSTQTPTTSTIANISAPSLTNLVPFNGSSVGTVAEGGYGKGKGKEEKDENMDRGEGGEKEE